MNGEKVVKKEIKSASKILMNILFACLLSIAGYSACMASTVVLQWEPVTDSDLGGYKVYYQADSSAQPFQGTGASEGSAPIDVPKDLIQTTATISGLDPEHAHHFAVTAYNTSGVESPYSNIVSIPEMVSPTVSISYPANNATVSNTVTVTATASDNVGVTKVEFYVNGALQASDTSTPYVFSWNASSLVIGAYTLTAKAYDNANNVTQSDDISVTVVNDTIPPTVSVTAPANNATISGIINVTANADDSVGVSKVEIYEDGALLSAGNVAPYSYSWDTTTVANGSHTLSAKAYDAANNFGQSSTVTVTVNNLDATVPTVTVAAPANNATVGGTVSVTATASDNIGVSKVEFYVNGVLKTTDTASPYTYSWNTTVLANGSYNLFARAYDAVNNIGQSSSITVTVNNQDSTAPTVSITAPASSATVSGTVSVTASASDNIGVSKVEFYVNGVLKATDASSPYAFSWNTTSAGNGSYTLFTKAYDAANNIGQSSTVTVTVNNPDTTAPTASITAPASSAAVSGTVSVTATAGDNIGVSKVEFYVNGVLKATDASSPYAFSWNTTSVVNGSYTLSAKAYDAANNIGQASTVTVTVNNQDSTAPTVSITAPASSATVSGTVAVTANASDNISVSKVEFYVNGVLSATDTSNTYSFNWATASVPNGSYSISAKSYDSAGNVGQSIHIPVTVSNTPTIAIITPLNGATYNANATIVLTATATASSSATISRVEFYKGSILLNSDTTSPYSFTWSKVPKGTYTVSAKAYDSSGASKISAPITVMVVSAATGVSFTSVSPASPRPVGTVVTFNATASGGSGTYQYQFLVKNPVTGWTVAKAYSTSSSFAWNTSGLPTGTYAIQVLARNVGSTISYEAWKTIKYALK